MHRLTERAYGMQHKNMMRIAAAALTLTLTGAALSACATGFFLGTKGKEKTVTITREEYDRLKQFERLDELMQIVNAFYYEEPDTDAMLEYAAIGLMVGLDDPYSFYYTPEDYASMNENVEGTYAGIGTQLLVDPEDTLMMVTRVFKGSPAEAAGVLSGDKIIGVDGVGYTGYEQNQAVAAMRGEPGTEVTITVLRGEETMDLTVQRAQIEMNYVEYEMLEDAIGYVIVYDFMGDAADGFKEAVSYFQQQGAKGMILDLRSNGGGLVTDAVAIADVLLPEGVIVSTEDRYGNRTEERSDEEALGLPLAVLVNGYSASASEIVAGAVKDTGVGTLVGEKTFGKGIMQAVFPFDSDGAGMQLTVARYFTPSGTCIHGIGIEPDVPVQQAEDVKLRYGINNIPRDKDVQLQKAVEVVRDQIAAEGSAE